MTRPASVEISNVSSNPQDIIYSLPSIVNPLELSSLFSVSQPLQVELGSGDGSFLVSHAAANPRHNFIGVERLLGRIRKMARKAKRGGLVNVRGIRIESSYFLEYLLPPASITALHVYFPDPWPKRKHRHYRLINERFPVLASKVLLSRGRVYLRTDDQDYFSQMLEVFRHAVGFRPVDTPAELAALLTDFERDFMARGISTLRAGFEFVA
jgi:tRNA (guanine-N7-)-methyltransferase